MNNEMRNLLIEFLHRDTIVASWGLSNINLHRTHLSFHVNALKYCGCIRISTSVENEDLYNVNFVSLDTPDISTSLSDIVSTIDGLIETSDMYYLHLIEWLDNNQTE